MFMYVLHSEGSSPGRQGFKMCVSRSRLIFGSIGGGIMEHKLVEWCRVALEGEDMVPFIKRQIHRDNVPHDKSGMICSGEQTIGFYRLGMKDIVWATAILDALSNGKYGVIVADVDGLRFTPAASLSNRFELHLSDAGKWCLEEDLRHHPILHIVGCGHVGLALSRFALLLGYVVNIYDDREGLNTMEQNVDANRVLVSNYENINDYLDAAQPAYVVLMSFGYRTDKIILRKLLSRDFKYLGMMGSKKKVKRLFKELLDEGFTTLQLNKVHAPIGLPIRSQTPEEIAVSILAEIVLVKNS